MTQSGDKSNPVSLKNLMGKILVFEELMFMKNLGSEVGNPGILGGILKDYFGIFTEMRQQDAGDALLAILDCIPDIERIF